MIATSVDEWAAAIWQYRRDWEFGHESELSRDVQNGCANALWTSARKFKVARNFSDDEEYRRSVARIVFDCPQPTTPDDFKKSVVCLAYNAHNTAKQINERRKEPHKLKLCYPLSALSKFLMLRFPGCGVVFDSHADRALWALNCMAPLEQEESGDKKFEKFERFFCRWNHVALPILNILNQNVFNRNSIVASRTLDKFLWLRGHNDPARAIHKRLKEMSYKKSDSARDQVYSRATEIYFLGVSASIFGHHRC